MAPEEKIGVMGNQFPIDQKQGPPAQKEKGMNLLEKQMEECLLLHPLAPGGAVDAVPASTVDSVPESTTDSVVTAADAAAGEWRPGATFPAAILPANPGILTKEPEEPSRLRCSVTTRPPVLLKYGDLFLRRQDGMVYRVLSDSRDTMTPSSSGLCMAQCRAERWGAWPGVTWPSEGL